MRITHNHRTQRTKDVWQYTEINDDGFVPSGVENSAAPTFPVSAIPTAIAIRRRFAP